MFREIDINVTVDDGITFRFAEPLSITSVTVACPATEEIEWELINDAFKPVQTTTESSFQMWPFDQALGRQFSLSVAEPGRSRPIGICRPLPYHVALLRRHAWISQHQGDWYVEGRFRNSVLVNGIAAERHSIQAGDRIRLAPSEIELLVSKREAP